LTLKKLISNLEVGKMKEKNILKRLRENGWNMKFDAREKALIEDISKITEDGITVNPVTLVNDMLEECKNRRLKITNYMKDVDKINTVEYQCETGYQQALFDLKSRLLERK
jgi:hypothetical protein